MISHRSHCVHTYRASNKHSSPSMWTRSTVWSEGPTSWRQSRTRCRQRRRRSCRRKWSTLSARARCRSSDSIPSCRSGCCKPTSSHLLRGDFNLLQTRAVVVGQLTARSLSIPEDLGSNPVIGNFYWKCLLLSVCREDENKEKRVREWPILNNL